MKEMMFLWEMRKKAINSDSNLDKTAFLDAPRPCRKECHALETNIDLIISAF